MNIGDTCLKVTGDIIIILGTKYMRRKQVLDTIRYYRVSAKFDVFFTHT